MGNNIYMGILSNTSNISQAMENDNYNYRYANIAPQTNLNTVIFPFDAVKMKYDTSVYVPLMTQNRLPQHDFDKFFEEVYKNCTMPNPKKFRKRLFIEFLLFIAFIIIGSASWGSSGTDDDDSWMFGIYCYCFAGFMYLFLLFDSICTAISIRSQFKAIRCQIQQIIDRDKQYFSGIGLRWRLPTDHARWIELWLDFRAQAQYMQGGQPAYQPPQY